MKTYLRVGTSAQSLALFLATCGLVACTTQEAKPDGGSGGNGGGTGGAAGAGQGNDGVACLPPAASGVITDFTYVPADGGAPVTDQVGFGDYTTTLSGGEFFYPNAMSTSTYKLMSDVTGGNWHLSGTVGDYSGMGLFFANCSRVDASAFKGISFTVSGTVMGGALTLQVATVADQIAASWLMSHGETGAKETDPGRCNPVATAVNQYAQTDCAPPVKTITVTATPTPVTVLWSDFTGGKPQASVTASDIIGIRWILPVPAGVGTASVVTYPLDLVIDNLAFVPK